MTAKEFLQQVFIAYQAADCKLEQMARLQSMATRTTTVIHSTPCGNGSALFSRIENAVASIQGQSEQLADEITHLLQVRSEVSAVVAKVANSAERRVLEYRYLCFYSWKEISHAMKIGIRTIYRLHEKALKDFAAVTNCHELAVTVTL